MEWAGDHSLVAALVSKMDLAFELVIQKSKVHRREGRSKTVLSCVTDVFQLEFNHLYLFGRERKECDWFCLFYLIIWSPGEKYAKTCGCYELATILCFTRELEMECLALVFFRLFPKWKPNTPFGFQLKNKWLTLLLKEKLALLGGIRHFQAFGNFGPKNLAHYTAFKPTSLYIIR